MVVRTDLEPNGVCRNQAVLAVYVFPNTTVVLIDHWLVLNYTGAIDLKKQVTVRINRNEVRTFKTKRNRVRVRARLYDEVVFEFPLIPVINQIDPAIYFVIPDACKCRDIGK